MSTLRDLENVLRMAVQPGDLVDDKEAAALLGLEVRTLRNWRSIRKDPRFWKIGDRTVRYLRSDLMTFVRADIDINEVRASR